MARIEKDFIRDVLGMRRQMERLLNDTVHCGPYPPSGGESVWLPAADVFETEKGFVVRMELAGIDHDGLEVTFEDGRLTVEGARFDAAGEGRVVCHQMEIPCGRFRRALPISREVDGSRVTAHYVDGLLTIRLPKSAPHDRRGVRIRVE